jgi:predicted esterase
MRKFISGPETFPQWFDVYDVRDFASREEIQLEGLREVIPEIIKILTQEAKLLGGRWDRLVLAGISMGAATSVHTLFNLEIPRAVGGGRLGAFLGFSARCPFAGRSLDDMRKLLNLEGCISNDGILTKTPMLLEHCIDDPLVLVKNGRGLRDTLMGFGAKVTWMEYPDGGHWFNAPQGRDDAIRFLNKVLGIHGHIDGANPDVNVDVDADGEMT